MTRILLNDPAAPAADRRTVRPLGVELPDLDTQLARLRHEMEALSCVTT